MGPSPQRSLLEVGGGRHAAITRGVNMDADIVLGTDEVKVLGTTIRVDATDLVVLGPANTVTVIPTSVTIGASDCMLDAASRRGQENRNRPRRALVHDFADGLTLNYNHDYPGGVTVFGPMRVLDHE